MEGKSVYTATGLNPETKEISLNIASLPSSAYILSVESMKGTYVAKIFIKN